MNIVFEEYTEKKSMYSLTDRQKNLVTAIMPCINDTVFEYLVNTNNTDMVSYDTTELQRPCTKIAKHFMQVIPRIFDVIEKYLNENGFKTLENEVKSLWIFIRKGGSLEELDKAIREAY